MNMFLISAIKRSILLFFVTTVVYGSQSILVDEDEKGNLSYNRISSSHSGKNSANKVSRCVTNVMASDQRERRSYPCSLMATSPAAPRRDERGVDGQKFFQNENCWNCISRKNFSCFTCCCCLFDYCKILFRKNKREESSAAVIPLLDYSDNITDASLIKKEILPDLDEDLILLLGSYLDCFGIIKLSHTKRVFRSVFSQVYWEEQIRKKRYVIWDNSCSVLKTYLANYYYHNGFGRHPALPENEAMERKEIVPLPNMIFAQKALSLGFPKGQIMYDQASHLLVVQSIEEKRKVDYSQNSSFVWQVPEDKFMKLR